MVFETGLFTMLHLIAKVIVQAAPVTQDDESLAFSFDIHEVRAHLDTVPTTTQRLFEVLVAYALTGQPAFARPYLLPQHQANLARVLADAAELFVVGHEYGHVVAGHLEEGTQRTQILGGNPFQEIVQNWASEFEADSIGLLLADMAMKLRGVDSSVSYIGSDLFLTCADLLGKAVSTIRSGDPDRGAISPTHPPAHLRRDRLRKNRSTRAACSSDAIGFARQVDDVANEMWIRLEPRVRRLHHEGHHLNPRWRRFN